MGNSGKCPHCGVVVLLQFTTADVGKEPDGIYPAHYKAEFANCPHCQKNVVYLGRHTAKKLGSSHRYSLDDAQLRLVHPRATGRAPVPTQVPPAIKSEFEEAALLVSVSAKASAASARRCLQATLEYLGADNSKVLDKQIDWYIARPGVPTHVASRLDHIRVVGNWAVHPVILRATGAIVDIEPDEAEWLLAILEALFDHEFVAPAILAAKVSGIDMKLDALGRKPLK